jgi:hypothetical protein
VRGGTPDTAKQRVPFDIRMLAGGSERFTHAIMNLANRPVALRSGRRTEWMTLFEAKLCLLSEQSGHERRATIAFIEVVMAAAERQQQSRRRPRPWGEAEFAIFDWIMQHGSEAQFAAALNQLSDGLPTPDDLSGRELIWLLEREGKLKPSRRPRNKSK